MTPENAAAERVHGGRTIFFCAKECAEAFDGDPEWSLGPQESRGSAKSHPSVLPPPVLRLGQADSPRGKRSKRGSKTRQATLPIIGEPKPISTKQESGTGKLSRREREKGIALALSGMHCASCVSTIEGALAEVPGVTEASVNPGTSR
ncbi:MAG: cation transporter, partial [Rubrobacteraceae bacterium]